MRLNDKLLFCKIEDLIVKTVLSAEHVINNATEMFCPYPKHNCFELFGFDILIDSKLEPWLLEVNLTPALSCDSPLDQKIKSNVIADLFTMIGVHSIEARMAEPIANKKQTVAYLGAPSVHNGLLQKPKKASKSVNARSSATEFGHTQSNQGSREEKQCLKETIEENQRRNLYRRVFPTYDFLYYKQFFEEERPLNFMIDKKLFAKKRVELASAKTQAEKMPLFMQV